jgi:hypothetical protein
MDVVNQLCPQCSLQDVSFVFGSWGLFLSLVECFSVYYHFNIFSLLSLFHELFLLMISFCEWKVIPEYLVWLVYWMRTLLACGILI